VKAAGRNREKPPIRAGPRRAAQARERPRHTACNPSQRPCK